MGTLGMTIDAPFGALLAGDFETPLALVMVVAIVVTGSISDALTPMNRLDEWVAHVDVR